MERFNLTIDALRKHIDELKWDDEFQILYDRASTGNIEDVFNLFIINYLDHDCTLRGMDLYLLSYCTLNNHKLAKELIRSEEKKFSKDDEYEILSYYRDRASNNGLLLWILGLCYESFDFDYNTYISLNDYDNATGHKNFVKAFESYKKSADLGFPLGVLYAYWYCLDPESYCISYIKDAEKLKEKYGDVLKQCGIRWPFE